MNRAELFANSLLPTNATALEKALDLTIAGRFAGIPVPISELWNPATCPAEQLANLAWAFHVDIWRVSWTVEVKRQMIAKTPFLHSVKGTPGSIHEALAVIGSKVHLTEWWQQLPNGTPHTFAVDLWANDYREDPAPILTAANQALILEMVETFKRKSQHFDMFTRASFTRPHGLAAVGQATPVLKATTRLAYRRKAPAKCGLAVTGFIIPILKLKLGAQIA